MVCIAQVYGGLYYTWLAYSARPRIVVHRGQSRFFFHIVYLHLEHTQTYPPSQETLFLQNKAKEIDGVCEYVTTCDCIKSANDKCKITGQ